MIASSDVLLILRTVTSVPCHVPVVSAATYAASCDPYLFLDSDGRGCCGETMLAVGED